jgi:hypothetical protein
MLVDNERQIWLSGGTETRTLTGWCRMNIESLTDRLNAPIQGSGVDGLKLTLALLWARRGECPGTELLAHIRPEPPRYRVHTPAITIYS